VVATAVDEIIGISEYCTERGEAELRQFLVITGDMVYIIGPVEQILRNLEIKTHCIGSPCQQVLQPFPGDRVAKLGIAHQNA
jgi:hypothetical protein